MRRRNFLVGMGTLAAWPGMSRAQPATTTVGLISPLSAASARYVIDGFRKGLSDLGYEEGRNIAVEYRYAEGVAARFPQLIAELIARKPEVLIVGSPGAAVEARKLTTSIPIVMNTSENPMALGLAKSLARPGGNVTGIWWGDEGLSGKRIELMREAVPRMTRVGILLNPNDRSDADIRASLPPIAEKLGIHFHILEAQSPAEFAAAFSTARREAVEGIQVALSPLFLAFRSELASLATQSQMPTVYGERQFALAGGLMSYGPNLASIYHRQAGLMDRILRGSSPADLPIERPSKFELVVNLKTAKNLGLTIPNSMQLLADEVIE